MTISVIVPTKNHSTDLEKCLASIQKQSKKPFEKIVVAFPDGDVETTAKKYGFRVVYDKKKTIGNAYRVGAKAAKGDIVLFIDDDSEAPKDLIKKFSSAFSKDPKMDVIGGNDRLPSRLPGKSKDFQEAAYQTDLAIRPKEKISGNDAWKWLRAACIAYRKSSLKKQSFDSRLLGLQEPELHVRMKKAGMKALYDPSIFVYHKRRTSLKGIWDQIHRNGKAKIDLIRIHRLSVLGIEDIVSLGLMPLAILFALLSWDRILFLGLTTTQFWILLIIFLNIIIKPAIILWHAQNKTGKYLKLIEIIFIKEIAYMGGLLVGIIEALLGRRKL